MTKKLGAYFKQILGLVGAVGLAVLVAVYGRETFPVKFQGKDEFEFAKFIIPLMTPVTYLIGAVFVAILGRIVPAIGRAIDDKAIFAGDYFSLPSDRDRLGVFRIKSDLLSGKYRLTGYTFSFHKDRATGSWYSDSLEMITKEPRTLIYAYWGIDYETNFEGRGYVKIGFGPDLRTGDGHWVEVPEDAQKPLVRKNAKYVKLTAKVRREFIDFVALDRHFPFILVRCLVRKPESIFKAFKASPDTVKNLPLFQRPP